MGGNKSMVFMGLGFELVLLVLGGAYLGGFIDKYFGWAGYGSAGIILVFMISWFYHLIILLKRINEEDDGS